MSVQGSGWGADAKDFDKGQPATAPSPPRLVYDCLSCRTKTELEASVQCPVCGCRILTKTTPAPRKVLVTD